jgi:hypothetical protein
MRAFAATLLVFFTGCESLTHSSSEGVDAATLAPQPIPHGEAPKKRLNDDGFIVILETGGFGSEDLFTVDIAGNAKDARATCSTEPGRRSRPDFRPWKRTAALTAEQIATLWEPLERVEWEVQKSEGTARQEGSASLTFKKGEKTRQFLAQKNCVCDSQPRPACCAGASVIQSLQALCFSQTLNEPPEDQYWKIELTRRSPDRRVETVTRIRSDERGVFATRETRASSELQAIFSGEVPTQTAQALWRALNDAYWPRLHQFKPVGARRERTLTIERGVTWASMDLDADGAQTAAALSLEIDRATAGLRELEPKTEVSFGPTRRPTPGRKPVLAECGVGKEGVECQTDPESSELYGTVCFPSSIGSNLFYCASTPDESIGVPVKAKTPVKLPKSPWPWHMELETGDMCAGPPPVDCGTIEIIKLVEGKKGWFVITKGDERPIGVRKLFSQPFKR